MDGIIATNSEINLIDSTTNNQIVNNNNNNNDMNPNDSSNQNDGRFVSVYFPQ
ncbi:hypothetical protein HUG17_5629 [Dermatophagoides farinae]|uniref:Uncharacterized protein n=1 Tax=Dermatophagoides farinae TaxID=6954 RepID=A0A9D4P2T4_DERFA|nr:hypothetical protein HUG17_5629 [Dermatophagoides farinae]